MVGNEVTGVSEELSKFALVRTLTPIKTIMGFKAINITLGIPFIRVSPDHGPNTLMLGKNLSNPSSLAEAIKFLDK